MESKLSAEPPILLVDDEADAREALQLLLETHGYGVVAAEDADAALARLRDGLQPSLILLDLLMPGKTGFQFRYEQVKDRRFADIPVIVYSAHADIITVARELGAAAYLQKPIEVTTLLRVVEAYRLK